MIRCISPTDGSVYAERPAATRAEADAIVGRAHAAKTGWAARPLADRIDLVKAGVVDPTKVTRSALQNASSISGLLLTTECLVTDIPEPEPAGDAGHSHDHGMGGMM